jgi:hypothetical protein
MATRIVKKLVETDKIDLLMCQSDKCPAKYNTVNVGQVSGDNLVVDTKCRFCGEEMDVFYERKTIEEEIEVTDSWGRFATPMSGNSSMKGKAYYERRSDKR